MELKIYSPTADRQIEKIKWNNEEIKKEVAQKLEYYKNIVYDETEIKEAKKDRASLKKFVEALENKRKEIKKQCLAPYEDFEKEEKEIVAMFSEATSSIDSQIKNFEQARKDKKLDEIKGLFVSAEFPEWVSFEQIFDERWLNVSVSVKNIETQIKNAREQIEKDLEMLRALPDFAFEAEQIYKTTFNVQKAITDAKVAFEIQTRKEKYEAEQKQALEEQKNQDKQPVSVSMPVVEQPATTETVHEEHKRAWLSFKANLTVDDALALKEFFNKRNIEFKSI